MKYKANPRNIVCAYDYVTLLSNVLYRLVVISYVAPFILYGIECLSLRGNYMSLKSGAIIGF